MNSFWIETVTAEGFRAFNRRQTVRWGRDYTIIGGPNGYGKTSLAEAVEWALWGGVARLTGGRDVQGTDPCRNRFLAPDLPYRVEVRLAGEGGPQTLTRTPEGVWLDGTPMSEADLKALVYPHLAQRSLDDLHSLFNPAAHAAQEQLAGFVRQHTPRERFDALSAVLDTSYIGEAYRAMDAEQRQADQAADRLHRDLRAAQERLRRATEDLDRHIELAGRRPEFASRTAALYHTFNGMRRSLYLAPLQFDAAAPLLPSLSQLGSAVASLQRQAEQLAERLGRHLALEEQLRPQEQAGKPEAAEAAEAEWRRLEQAVQEQADRVETARREMAAARQALDAFRQGREAVLRFLSEARGHITGDVCPLCLQRIAHVELLRRIDERTAQAPSELARLMEADQAAQRTYRELAGRLEELREAARRQEHVWSQAAAEAQELQAHVLERSHLRAAADDLAPALRQVTLPEAHQFLQSFLAPLQSLSDDVAALLRDPSLAVLERPAQELVETQRLAAEERDHLQRRLDVQRVLGGRLERLSRATLEAERNIVQSIASRIQPTMQEIFARLSPHLIFRQVRLEFCDWGGRGELFLRAEQEDGADPVNAPALFSTAHANCLALSIFFALSLATRSRLPLMMIDDPAQSLDDVNLLGLTDVLAAMRGRRQVLLTTHGRELFDFLRSRLSTGGADVQAVWFHNWSREGPDVQVEAPYPAIKENLLPVLEAVAREK